MSLTTKRILLSTLILWFCAVGVIGLFFTERNEYTTGGGFFDRPRSEFTCGDARPFHDALRTYEAKKRRWDASLRELMTWDAFSDEPRPELAEPPGITPLWRDYAPASAPSFYQDDWRTTCATGSNSTVLISAYTPPPVVFHSEWIWPKTQWLFASVLATLVAVATIALRAVWSGGQPGVQNPGSTERPQGE